MSITKLTLAAFAFTYGNAISLESQGVLKAQWETSNEEKAQIAAKCENMHGVNEPSGNSNTSTFNFNWMYARAPRSRAYLYSLLGNEHYPEITAESC